MSALRRRPILLRKLRTAGTLSLAEWGLFFKAWLWLLAVDLGLRLLPFRRLQAWLGAPVALAPVPIPNAAAAPNPPAASGAVATAAAVPASGSLPPTPAAPTDLAFDTLPGLVSATQPAASPSAPAAPSPAPATVPVASSLSPEERTALVLRASRAIERAARNHLYPMTCLRRSLALQLLLARQGLPSLLRFGVQRLPEGFSAHAWLEIDGQPVNEPETVTERFAPLAFAQHSPRPDPAGDLPAQ